MIDKVFVNKASPNWDALNFVKIYRMSDIDF